MPELIWQYVKTPLDGDNLIATLAEKLGIAVPQTYIDLAVKNNGGRPNRKIFPSAQGILSFRRLLRIDSNGEENINQIAEDILAYNVKLFPFGDDSFGNYFCFAATQENQQAAVVFFDHETGKQTILADTFQDFLDKLQES